jgi:hypothetical protein
MSWARLLKRVFDIDIDHCPNCGGSLKIIAAPSTRLRTGIEDPPVIVRTLTHLGLPTRPAARPGAASRFIPDNLRAENRLPTQADGAARSEFERKRTQWALTKEEMRNCVWLKPELVAQIEFTEWTLDGHLSLSG